MKTWYAQRSAGLGQGLVIDEKTGANVAVVYDRENTPLLASAPKLLAALEALTEHSAGINTAFYGNGTTRALRAAFNGQKELLQNARAAIAEAKEAL